MWVLPFICISGCVIQNSRVQDRVDVCSPSACASRVRAVTTMKPLKTMPMMNTTTVITRMGTNMTTAESMIMVTAAPPVDTTMGMDIRTRMATMHVGMTMRTRGHLQKAEKRSVE